MTTISKSELAHLVDLLRNDDWDGAHRLVQDYPDAFSCEVHGYLHRVEGDLSNADYWYGRAGAVRPASPVTVERDELIVRIQDNIAPA